jgi:rare lipoprotein A
MARSIPPAGRTLPAGSSGAARQASRESGGAGGRARAVAAVAAAVAVVGPVAPAAYAGGDPGADHQRAADAARTSAKRGPRRAGRLAVPRPVMLGSLLTVRGRLRGLRPGARLSLQRLSPSGRWVRVAAGRTSRGGAFTIRWRPRRPGRFTIRVVAQDGASRWALRWSPAHDTQATVQPASAGAAAPPPDQGRPAPATPTAPTPGAGTPASPAAPAAAPARTVTRKRARRTRRSRSQRVTVRRHAMVYAPAVASWFGPGFYGSRTACGQVLTPHTMGVAHRSLPCGTRVAVSYRGTFAIVPVIDRGPFHYQRTWDLTGALARRLGFAGAGTVGTVVLMPRSRR